MADIIKSTCMHILAEKPAGVTEKHFPSQNYPVPDWCKKCSQEIFVSYFLDCNRHCISEKKSPYQESMLVLLINN